ncbi:MAG: hypothetical protein ACO1OD_04445 [Croceibacterium sp.]
MNRGAAERNAIVAWWESLGRPLRRLPRWAAALLLLATAAACLWSAPAIEAYGAFSREANDQRLEAGGRADFDLYEAIDRRIASGESYYSAALDEQRSSRFPTKPIVTVRPPTLAWSSLVLGLDGWRVAATALWLATIIGLYAALKGTVGKLERIAAALCAAAAGAVAGIEKVGLSHEIVAGLLVSASLALYRRERWWPALLLAAGAVAVREMALPFLLLWATFAALERRWREFAAVAAVIVLFGAGMALHAQAVVAHQLPGDLVSPGWTGFQGPALPLFGIVTVTLLQTLPVWLAAPLAVLPLLGWLGLGGRLGLFATLWFAGYALAVALFARQENFYWLALLIPAYGAGLALVPRALADLTAALRGRPLRAATPGSPTR